MTSWLKKIDTSRLKQIFIVHGEPEAQEFFRNHLAGNGFPDAHIVRYGERWTV